MVPFGRVQFERVGFRVYRHIGSDYPTHWQYWGYVYFDNVLSSCLVYYVLLRLIFDGLELELIFQMWNCLSTGPSIINKASA